MTRERELVELLSAHESLLVVCHNNPDPDCLASALALERIADDAGIASVCFAYNGHISHQQNRALVDRLNIELSEFETAMLDEYDLVAFVDHSIPGVNNEVPSETELDIVIDHHPADDVQATFVDHREEIGAAATILVEYLHDLSIVPSADLATALLFAIRSETLAFTRMITPREYAAAEFLQSHVNLSLLNELLSAPYTPATVDALATAIDNREIQHVSLVSHAGEPQERDALPQAADFLLNLQGITTAIVFGVIEDEIQFSARSVAPNVHAGELLRETFGTLGSMGGHSEMAGGRIPLTVFEDGSDRDTVITIAARLVTFELFQEMNEQMEVNG